ncbi:MAG TPA: M14 family zinc carboxypeptidase, partial [Planctomycetaceae bacterium]|nr:M14 family zinc carboxypeptidase [Planctomycetaceae bacterium]
AAQLHAPPPRPRGSARRPEVSAAHVSATGRPAILDEPTWSRFYRSTDRRAIESLIVGSGPSRIAIIASLHGDETQSVSLVEEFARSVQRRPQVLKHATVLFVKCPNPDGFISRSPYNIHGVDLNRNFPSANWKGLSNGRSGAKPASEAETRVAMRLLSDFRPALLVHIKDSRGAAVVNYDGASQARAERMASLASAQSVQGLGEKTSGSIENYALTRLACPSVTLLLARDDSDEAAWAKNHDALLSLLEPQPSASPSDDRVSSIDNQPDPFEERPAKKPSSRQQQPAAQNTAARSELPNTNRVKKPVADFPAPVPEKGYLELPPP